MLYVFGTDPLGRIVELYDQTPYECVAQLRAVEAELEGWSDIKIARQD